MRYGIVSRLDTLGHVIWGLRSKNWSFIRKLITVITNFPSKHVMMWLRSRDVGSKVKKFVEFTTAHNKQLKSNVLPDLPDGNFPSGRPGRTSLFSCLLFTLATYRV